MENKHSYPRPAAGTGTKLGLNIVLNANTKDYYCSSTSSYGFKILLHSPIESPKIENFGASISTSFETNIVLTPVLSQASPRIRRVPIETRACIFENENHLKYFR